MGTNRNNAMEQDDNVIIQQCLAGDSDSYAVLVERHKDLVFTLAYRMLGDSDAANDMAQEAFISAYAALKDFKGTSKFSSWLCSIVINKCRDHLRRKKGNVPLDEIAEFCGNGAPTPDELAYAGEVGGHLQRALNSLPADYREAVILKHIEEFDYREMAEILGVPAETLKVRTHRARGMLRKLLVQVMSS